MQIKNLIVRLHFEQGLSLGDIARLIGNKTSGYTSWLCKELQIKPRPFEESRLEAIREKRRKYERRPFDGTDEDRAYLLGLRHGDLSVSRPWNGAIRVSTSTTHPAMAELFRGLFEPFGHVYQHPRYKKDTRSYEWNLSTILDSSFDFLLDVFADSRDAIERSQSTFLAYISGLLDAEGSIVVTRDSRRKITIFLDYYNSNKSMLEWIEGLVRKLGYYTSLRINKREGTRTKKYDIVHRSDYWQLSIFSKHQINGLLVQLHPRHPEKVRRMAIALSTVADEDYSDVVERIIELRASIRKQVADFVKEAEGQYKRTHPTLFSV